VGNHPALPADHSGMAASNRLFPSLALLLVTATSGACTTFATDDTPVDRGAGGAQEEGPKAAPVPRTPGPGELTEAFGFFVALTGKDTNDGSRVAPFASIQHAITSGKKAGKRVYVCNGTYRETLTLGDSISIIGGLDCANGSWKYGGSRARVEAPRSPAVVAKGVTSPTRIDGLDIVAPDATEAGASSIGLLADHSTALTIAGSTINAGNGANGVAGADAVQLTLDAAAAAGGASLADARCMLNSTCDAVGGAPFMWAKPNGAAGGVSTCSGAAGHDGQSGGAGGSGGLFITSGTVQLGFSFGYYGSLAANAPSSGEDRPRTVAGAGVDGTNGKPVGTLTPDGYVGMSGGAGTDGAPGNGGSGGRGSPPRTRALFAGDVWRGLSGPGGGAGGCPGLAGMPGGGGGASIALALIESPVVVEGSQLIAAAGGAGGLGTFGSDPTEGGLAGTNLSVDVNDAARDGGRGGAPGSSANGTSGPSFGILVVGAPASLIGTSKVTAGDGGRALPLASRTDDFGNVRTIPSSPAGLSKETHAL